MGEVYRATDTNLKRQVAIKVLPASVAADVDRLARFQREKRKSSPRSTTRTSRRSTGWRRRPSAPLVMELVEGEDLSQRIARLRAQGGRSCRQGRAAWCACRTVLSTPHVTRRPACGVRVQRHP
jgi:serine/threonine protein kinase